jgi:hypothetical protein
MEFRGRDNQQVLRPGQDRPGTGNPVGSGDRAIASAPAIVAATVRVHAIAPAATEPIVRIDLQASKAREEVAPRPPTVGAVARVQTAAGATRRSGTYPPAPRPIFMQPAAEGVLPVRESRARVSAGAFAAAAAAEAEVSAAAAAVAPTLR